mmetsp:Transcript_26444/g.90391  ORF Transcript_26444/g.90391 Transcript_26444/m.90391 type:complete len:168 (+) Transcript_26444:308-811(+)
MSAGVGRECLGRSLAGGMRCATAAPQGQQVSWATRGSPPLHCPKPRRDNGPVTASPWPGRVGSEPCDFGSTAYQTTAARNDTRSDEIRSILQGGFNVGSPPVVACSPPQRSSNPLVKDTRFERLNAAAPYAAYTAETDAVMADTGGPVAMAIPPRPVQMGFHVTAHR